MRNKLWTTLLITLFIGSTSAYAAKLYKWTDEHGKVHYSEKAPTAEELVGTPDAEPEGEADPAASTPVVIPEPVDMAASQRAADRCQGLMSDLELYKSNTPNVDSDGNPMILSPEMREAKITEINAQLDESCR